MKSKYEMQLAAATSRPAIPNIGVRNIVKARVMKESNPYISEKREGPSKILKLQTWSEYLPLIALAVVKQAPDPATRILQMPHIIILK